MFLSLLAPNFESIKKLKKPKNNMISCAWTTKFEAELHSLPLHELPRSNNEEWHDILALEAIVMHVATQKGWSIIIIWNWGWKKVSLTRTAGELSKLRLASFTTKPNEWWRISARNIHSCAADWLTHPPTSLFKTPRSGLNLNTTKFPSRFYACYRSVMRPKIHKW